jgi:hypothetical protein
MNGSKDPEAAINSSHIRPKVAIIVAAIFSIERLGLAPVLGYNCDNERIGGELSTFKPHPIEYRLSNFGRSREKYGETDLL